MKRPAADDEPQRRILSDGEWKKVKERFASWGRNADDDWKKYKKGWAGIGIHVADTVKAELFGPFLKPLCRDLTDDEWNEIKRCLANKDIDIIADTMRVQLFGSGPLCSLREAVPC